MSLRKQLNEYKQKYPYPRRRFIRRALRGAIRMAASVITDYRVEGQENLPKQGPLLIVGNHFHFLDTIGPIHCTDYFLEFINDSVMPNAPATMKFLPSLWGTLKILQGTANLEAMRASEAVLAQGGILAIFPEGHVHRLPLGKPLPGASFLALRSGVPILPIATYSEDEWNLFGAQKAPRADRHPHRQALWPTRDWGPAKNPRPGRSESCRLGNHESHSRFAPQACPRNL